MVIGPSFVLKGFEPVGVRTAPLDDRQAFWAAVAGFVVEAKAQELMAGLDRFGNPFVSLRPKTIKYRKSAMGPADPNAPPLQPAHGLSRTRSLFTVETLPGADGLACYWAYDSITGASWGEILDYHREGAGALPVRDVFGLSPQSIGIVKRRASDWWTGYILGHGVSIGPGPPMPTGGPGPPGFRKRGSGWGRVTILPGGGPRTERQNKQLRIKQGNHVYTLQGGMGFGAPPSPPGPPVYKNKTPKPPTLPNAREIRNRAKLKVPINSGVQPIEPPQPIKVTILGNPADLRAELKKAAPGVSVSDLRGLVGASDDAKVQALVMTKGGIYVDAVTPNYEARIHINDGVMKITQLDVAPAMQGKGIGSEIINRIIAAAEKAGIREITMDASRSEEAIGYAVWPQFGFDGPIPPSVAAKLPDWLQGATTVGDLFQTPEGRVWWKQNGVSVQLSLKLTGRRP